MTPGLFCVEDWPKARISILILLFLFSNKPAYAQQAGADTTVQADSIKSSEKEQPPELLGPIKYWADDISLKDNGSRINLKGNAKIIYQNKVLTAAFIRIDRENKLLTAWGVADSLDKDGHPVLRGTPVFEEPGQEPMRGDRIEYNFETERGKVRMGKTEMEPGYYRGAQINRIADSTLLISDGIFTSCEYIDHPHFYFQSQEIRLKVKDKVIARPIVFYIGDVPLAWLPFGIFPNKRGRHSGIVIPKYGESQSGGRFLRGMGYYWAPNDYFDATLLTDYYDKRGFAFSADANYTIRYKLNGSVSGEYFPRDPYSGARVERWRMKFSHSQQIDPTFRISGSGSFSSDKDFARDLSSSINDRLNQNISSSLNLSKSWKGTKNSMSLSVSRQENLKNGNTSYVLPSLSFNHSNSSLYESITGDKVGGKRNWYQNIYYSYSSSLINKGSRTLQRDSSFADNQNSGVQHRLAFSAPMNILKYININPNLSFNEDWVDEVTTAVYDSSTKKITYRQQKQFAARHTFTGSISAKTTLYGLFEPNIGQLRYIRHKVDPSVSFNYTPDFSTDFFGYYDKVADSNGNMVRFDRFRNSVFGGTSARRSRSMSLHLGNVFQGKMIDEEGKEKKLDLLTANFSTNYNLEADSLKWSTLSTNLRTIILGKNIDLRMMHSFYKPNYLGTGQIDQFEGFPRLLNLSTSLGFNLNNKTFAKKEAEQSGKSRRGRRQGSQPDETDVESDTESDEGILSLDNANQGIRAKDNEMEATKKLNIPWSLALNMNYSLNKANVHKTIQNIDLSANANLQLTQNWKISWSARFDLAKRDLVYQSFNIYRDLHCWEMAFTWQPNSNRNMEYYSFQINIKASMLQDIKVTKHPMRSVRMPLY
jgi:lipopolysaccharide assembly outer membrane protein LptD (OstA)